MPSVSAVIGDILPLAVGVGVFPVPIIATLLTLSSSRGRANGAAFATAWVLGVGVVTTVVALVTDGAASAAEDATHTAAGVLELVIGIALLGLALHKWRGRPAAGATATVPKWMRSIDRHTPGKAARTGLLLSAGSPKNWGLVAAAGSTIGEAQLPAWDTILCVAIFTGLASLTVVGPVLYRAWGGERAERALDDAQSWLIQNNAAIMTVVLVVLGVQLVGKAITALGAPG